HSGGLRSSLVAPPRQWRGELHSEALRWRGCRAPATRHSRCYTVAFRLIDKSESAARTSWHRPAIMATPLSDRVLAVHSVEGFLRAVSSSDQQPGSTPWR